MGQTSIFGEPGGADRAAQPPSPTQTRRPNPSHGLFGAKLLPEARRAGGKSDRPEGRG